MLSRLWIAFLISLSGILTIAWLVALMHEKDIRPVRDMVGFFKKQSKTGRVVFGIMFLAFWLIASVKPDGGGNGGDPGGGDGGGTNNVQMVVSRADGCQPRQRAGKCCQCGSVANYQYQCPIGGNCPIGKWQHWNWQHFHNGNINNLDEYAPHDYRR